MLSNSVNVPVERYAMSRTGMTISFAGKPMIKAVKMKPSSPISVAMGFRKPATCASMLESPI